jgi:hypothetical protein
VNLVTLVPRVTVVTCDFKVDSFREKVTKVAIKTLKKIKEGPGGGWVAWVGGWVAWVGGWVGGWV